MYFAFAQDFDAGNLAEARQIARPEFVTDKEIAQYPRLPVYYFEFECRCDNQSSTFKSYFNFLVRPRSDGASSGVVPFYEFAAMPEVPFYPSILVFCWRNPPNPKRLTGNLYRATYRFFEQRPRRSYYSQTQLYDDLMTEFSALDARLIAPNAFFPDYHYAFFQNTRPARATADYQQIVFALVVNYQETSGLLYVAYCAPYSLSHIYFKFCGLKHLAPAFPDRPRIEQELIGRSVLNFPLLAFKFSAGTREKPVCALTARVHPGETLSSYVLDGFILAVLNGRIRLLDHYDLLIVPCINLDGCYLGNYRSDSLSQNLNRAYDESDPDRFPINIALRNLIQAVRPRILIDMHNHASILSAVLFGNDILTDFKQNRVENLKPAAVEYVLNLLFCKLISRYPYVNTTKCDFSYNRMESEDGRGEGFDGTLRVVARRELDVRFAYTLETHYFCYETAGNKRFWFIKEFHEIGELLAQSLCDFNCLTGLKLFLDRICYFLPTGFELKRWFLKSNTLDEREIREYWEKGIIGGDVYH